MCETVYSKIKVFPDRGKYVDKGQFYAIMIGVEVEIKQPQYYCPGELVAI